MEGRDRVARVRNRIDLALSMPKPTAPDDHAVQLVRDSVWDLVDFVSNMGHADVNTAKRMADQIKRVPS